MAQVAFIGLGNMGGGMAANLVKAGFEVRAFDLSPAALSSAVEAGCTACDSAADAVGSADYVVSMLPNGAIVESIYIDKDNLLDVIPQSALVMDCSTISAQSSRRLAKEAQARGIPCIDAPVSGGVQPRPRVPWPLCAEVPGRISKQPGQCCLPWVQRYFEPGTVAPGRLPRCAITCCSRFT